MEKTLIKYSLDEKYADDNFVKRIVDFYAEEHGLTNFINKLTTTDIKNEESSYDLATKNLTINTNASNKHLIYKDKELNILQNNLYVLFDILKHLDYVTLNKELNKNVIRLDVMLCEKILNIEKQNEKRRLNKVAKKHPYEIPYEVRSNYAAYKGVLNTIDNLKISFTKEEKTRKLYDFFLDKYAEVILRTYKYYKNPSIDFVKEIIDGFDLKIQGDFPFEEKLKRGIAITPTEKELVKTRKYTIK